MADAAQKIDPTTDPNADKGKALPRPGDAKDTTIVAQPRKFHGGSIVQYSNEFAGRVWNFPVEDDVTLDDVLNPAFWGNIAAQMEPEQEIKLKLGGEKPMRLWLLVCATGNQWAQVRILLKTPLDDAAQEEMGLRLRDDDNDFTARYKNAHMKWIVERRSDKVIISEGHASRTAAETYIAEHKKALRK